MVLWVLWSNLPFLLDKTVTSQAGSTAVAVETVPRQSTCVHQISTHGRQISCGDLYLESISRIWLSNTRGLGVGVSRFPPCNSAHILLGNQIFFRCRFISGKIHGCGSLFWRLPPFGLCWLDDRRAWLEYREGDSFDGSRSLLRWWQRIPTASYNDSF